MCSHQSCHFQFSEDKCSSGINKYCVVLNQHFAVSLHFICSEFYEPGAMMIEDEGMVFTGLLVGLNVIDCNMCIKEEDLDQPVCGSVLN
jgi:hypothetical protein